MQSVIVSVKLQGDGKEYDLEVPADVPSRKLAELIVHNIDPNSSTRGALAIRCLKPGTANLLSPDVSLAGSGLWDGVLLEIIPESVISGPTWAGILLGWDPLGTDVPARKTPSIPRNSQAGGPEQPPANPPPPPPITSPSLDDIEWLPLMDDLPGQEKLDETAGRNPGHTGNNR